MSTYITLHVVHNPGYEVACLSVDPGVARLTTPVAPACDPRELQEVPVAGGGGTHQRTAGVSLTEAFTALQVPGAHHAASDADTVIGQETLLRRVDGHRHLHQDPGQAAALGGRAPARDPADGPRDGLLALQWQGDRPWGQRLPLQVVVVGS